MKIAIVSQPIDCVLPPYQNSIGVCSYGSACALAQDHEVVVYGLSAANDGATTVIDRKVKFRFLEEKTADKLLFKVRTRISRVVELQPVSSSPLYYPEYGKDVARELQREGFDLIHIQHSSHYASIIRKYNPRAKIVLHLHAEWFSQSKPTRLQERVETLDMLTGVSDHVSNRVKRLLPNLTKPCITHYNGFDPTEFGQEKDYRSQDQRRERHILFAGGISPHKGLHVLIEAFKLVALKVPEVRLNLSGPAGTYPFEETFDKTDRALRASLAPFYSRRVSPFKKLLSSGSSVTPDYVAMLKAQLTGDIADKVVFLGRIPRSELVARFYDSDIFVFPSLFAEGFGLPPVEAMAAGTAVIGTRSGAIPETVEHGVTGLLVEKNDPVGLADAMLRLLQNSELREKMGRAGRNRALQNFTWDRVTETVSANYNKLCGVAQPSPTKSRGSG
jgi:glycosyltransferase involved in cell wall biosynthesis